ncbi:MAG TPA: aminopeptidase P N-terminal domain-containing protein [Thermoanaerobaculia bacterium]
MRFWFFLRLLGIVPALGAAAGMAALEPPPIAAPPSMFAAHRERLLAKMPPGSVAVFKSAPVADLPGNVDFEYRQNSDFWWVTGFGDPEAAAVLRKTETGATFTLFVRRKDARREAYDGFRPTPAEAAAAAGAQEAYLIDEVWTRLSSKDAQTGAWSGLLAGATSVFLSDGGDKEFGAKLKAAVAELATAERPAAPVTEAREIVHELRLVKDDEELKLLRRASEISGRAHVRAMREAAPGKWEFEIQAALDGYCQSQGARRMAYPSIVGSGPNALTLHYDKSARQARAGELVLNDSACEYQYYASDITRTYPVSGKFSPEQRAVYEVVLAAQKTAIAAVKPGVPRSDVENAALRAQVEGLLRLGLMTGTLDELIRNQAHRRLTLHGVSHWVGLDVHDPGRLANSDGKPRPLEPGMVFTIEPGIYLPMAGDIPEKYQGIGVRVEDVVLVTKDGVDCLTCFVPKELADVEGAVAAGAGPAASSN